jgi:hypothetical protein
VDGFDASVLRLLLDFKAVLCVLVWPCVVQLPHMVLVGGDEWWWTVHHCCCCDWLFCLCVRCDWRFDFVRGAALVLSDVFEYLKFESHFENSAVTGTRASRAGRRSWAMLVNQQ